LGDPEPLDQSDFVGWRSRRGEFDPPIYLWLEDDGKPTVCLSNTSDACEKIQLCDAQDIEDLIKRLARARQDVFGRPGSPIIDGIARYLQLKDFEGDHSAADEHWQEGYEPDDYKEAYRKDARNIFNIIAEGVLNK
jgi:hypothetical protein